MVLLSLVFFKTELVFLWFANAIYRMPWLVLCILRECLSHQLLIHNHKMKLTMFEKRVLLKQYWKQDYKAAAAATRIYEMEGEGSLVSMWHNDGPNVSTLEKDTLKIYHVLEDLNYGIVRTYAEFWKKIRRKILVGCQKNFVHQKTPYIGRLKHLENHTEAVDLYLMN